MSKKNARRIRRIRRELFYKDRHCVWCGIETILWEEPIGPAPHNAATLDHLTTRFQVQRAKGKDASADYRGVLACKKCNEARSKEEVDRLSWEEKWKFAQAFPREFQLGMAMINPS
jgi:hypothetical protein